MTPQRATDVGTARHVPQARNRDVSDDAIRRDDAHEEVHRPQKRWDMLDDERREARAVVQLAAADDSSPLHRDDLALDGLGQRSSGEPRADLGSCLRNAQVPAVFELGQSRVDLLPLGIVLRLAHLDALGSLVRTHS